MVKQTMTPLNEVMFQLQKHELNRDLTLHKGCYIPNIKNTVESLLRVLKSQKGNRAYLPYYFTIVNILNKLNDE
jgi:hypothetical protein